MAWGVPGSSQAFVGSICSNRKGAWSDITIERRSQWGFENAARAVRGAVSRNRSRPIHRQYPLPAIAFHLTLQLSICEILDDDLLGLGRTVALPPSRRSSTDRSAWGSWYNAANPADGKPGGRPRWYPFLPAHIR